MSICLWTKKIFESYFRNGLTFSNIRSRTSRRIYRLALPLCAPEMLSSLSKSRISIFKAHLTLFVRRMTSHNSIGKYRHLVNWLGTERRRWQTRQVESLQNWKEVNVGSSACLVNWLGPRYSRIVCKLYQFHIVTVVELRSVFYNSQFCPLTYRSQYSYFLLTTLSLFSAAMSKRSRKPSIKVMECYIQD